MRLQINPAFLFNALGAISELVDKGRKDDAELLVFELKRAGFAPEASSSRVGWRPRVWRRRRASRRDGASSVPDEVAPDLSRAV